MGPQELDRAQLGRAAESPRDRAGPKHVEGVQPLGKLAGIPAALIHGRRDLSCPADTAYALAQAWPDAELALVDDSGHKGSPAFTEAMQSAVRRFTP